MENKNLTIMFTDIKGFTQRTSLQSRIATAELISSTTTFWRQFLKNAAEK